MRLFVFESKLKCVQHFYRFTDSKTFMLGLFSRTRQSIITYCLQFIWGRLLHPQWWHFVTLHTTCPLHITVSRTLTLKGSGLSFLESYALTATIFLYRKPSANSPLVISLKPLLNFFFIHLLYIEALNKICLIFSFHCGCPQDSWGHFGPL